jgi:esterase/lipase superfamily enzyme
MTDKEAADHLERHRRLMREFLQLREDDPQRALAYAESEVQKAKGLRRNDPDRGDALELLVLAHEKLEEYEKALTPAAEVVRIRKAARPVDHDLVALALGTHAVILFALDRGAEADETLREQLATWRKALDPNDIRLAQKLEAHAEYVQKGFGRRRWVIELLKEAIAIREGAKDRSGRLAATVQELAIQQLLQSEQSEADTNLVKAGKLLEAEIARDPAREENRAGLSQILILRAGIAGSSAQKERALAYADRARKIKFKDKLLQVENDILVAAALTSILENMGDIEGAIVEQNKTLDLLLGNQQLIADGSLDARSVADALSWLGSLYLEQNELGLARQAITSALRQTGDTSDLLFKMSELERKSGNETTALNYYQKGLKLRKTDASEVPVIFGTNRLLEPGPEPARFGGEPGDRVSLGDAVVLVPGGQFSGDAWLQSSLPIPIPVGMATNPQRLIIRSKNVLSAADFRSNVRRSVAAARLYPDSALVFVHGYNVTFDDALRRAAQLVRDLNYDGAAFAFSWPSKGNWWKYGADRASAGKATQSLVEFLHTVAATTGAEKIHIIAHSMGNRVLLPALLEIARNAKSAVRAKVAEVILAAPAVPQKEFAEWIDELSGKGFQRFTLYASAVDKALLAGYVREWGTVLAGRVANGEPLVHAAVQSIDVSEAGSEGLTNLNHDVFASNPVLTEDIRQLLQKGQRPPHRRIPTLKERSAKIASRTYWYYGQPAAGQ